MRAPSLLWIAVIGCGACGGTAVEMLPPPPGAETPDAGVASQQPSTKITVEVGTGETEFQAIAGGAELELIQAAQTGGGNGEHFWIAVRASDFDPDYVHVHVTLTRVSDGFKVSDLARDENFTASGSSATLVGFRAVITQCFDVMNEELSVTAELTDKHGKTGSDTRRFRAPMYCRRLCTDCDKG